MVFQNDNESIFAFESFNGSADAYEAKLRDASIISHPSLTSH